MVKRVFTRSTPGNQTKDETSSKTESKIEYPTDIAGDEEALRIHGILNSSSEYSSDGGKSEFDEEYFRFRPDPIPIDKSKLIVIRKTTNNNAGKSSNAITTHKRKGPNKGYPRGRPQNKQSDIQNNIFKTNTKQENLRVPAKNSQVEGKQRNSFQNKHAAPSDETRTNNDYKALEEGLRVLQVERRQVVTKQLSIRSQRVSNNFGPKIFRMPNTGNPRGVPVPPYTTPAVGTNLIRLPRTASPTSVSVSSDKPNAVRNFSTIRRQPFVRAVDPNLRMLHTVNPTSAVVEAPRNTLVRAADPNLRMLHTVNPTGAVAEAPRNTLVRAADANLRMLPTVNPTSAVVEAPRNTQVRNHHNIVQQPSNRDSAVHSDGAESTRNLVPDEEPGCWTGFCGTIFCFVCLS